MTDRYKGLLVTLEINIREDDAEDLIKAIEMLKGVLTVDPVPTNSDDFIIRERIRSELIHKLFEVLKD